MKRECGKRQLALGDGVETWCGGNFKTKKKEEKKEKINFCLLELPCYERHKSLIVLVIIPGRICCAIINLLGDLFLGHHSNH